MSSKVQPWYREPWPWFLMALPAIAVIGSLTSAYLAVQGADPIIEDNYYQRGLEINSTLQRVHTAAQWGVHASVEYDGVERGETVWVRVRSAQPVKDTALQIHLIHPGRSGADRAALLGRVPDTPDTDAEFTGQWPDDAFAPASGTRRVPVNWRIALQGLDWQVEGDALGRNDIQAR
jgi:hypothetical protein